MKDNRTYREKIQERIIEFSKVGNKDAVAYYQECLASTSACASWETFKNSWAGKQWLAKRYPQPDTRPLFGVLFDYQNDTRPTFKMVKLP